MINKLLLTSAIFILSSVAFASTCKNTQEAITSNSKLYIAIEKQTPKKLTKQVERLGKIKKLFITEKCESVVVTRFQTLAFNFKTNKEVESPFSCKAVVDKKSLKATFINCLPMTSTQDSSYEGPRAYPYGDVNDPFSSPTSNGPSYGDEDPSTPENGDWGNPDDGEDSDYNF